MRNKWYSDNRDLVKWSILTHLARMASVARILQIAYFRHDDFEAIEIDGKQFEIPSEVKSHFRDIRRIEDLSSHVEINVFDAVFQNREVYHLQARDFIKSFAKEKCIVFLDPDTGLEPAHPNLTHVLEEEIRKIWVALKSGDVLVFYQHQTNRNGAPWIEPKRSQFERAIKAPNGSVKIAHGFKLARDVAFFYVKKAYRVAGGFSPPAPTPPSMRVRTGRFPKNIEP